MHILQGRGGGVNWGDEGVHLKGGRGGDMVWWCVMWGDERAFRGGGHLKGGEGRGGDMVVC